MKKSICNFVLTLAFAFYGTAGAVLNSIPVSLPTVAAVAVVVALPATQTACSKDQLIAAGQDVLDVLNNTELRRALETLSPSVLAKVLATVPTAKKLIELIRAGDLTSAIGIVNTIFPLIDEVLSVVLVASSPQILAIVALANIGLHFIINHVKQGAPNSLPSILPSADIQQAVDYGNQPVWGCQYRKDKRCAALAH